MRRTGTAADFGPGQGRDRFPQTAGRGGRGASDGRAPLDPESARALLTASGPVQYAPPAGVMRPPMIASVNRPADAPAGPDGVDVAAEAWREGASGDRPTLRADEPLAGSVPPARRPRSSMRPVLLGGAALLAIAAAAGGYLTYERQWDGFGGPAVAADAGEGTPLSPAAGETVAPRVPARMTAAVPPASGPEAAPVSARPAAKPETRQPTTTAAIPATAEDTGPAPAPLDQRTMIRDAQRALADAGLDPGPADGLMGPKTRAAVIAFQRRVGVEADGEVDAALLERLTEATGRTVGLPEGLSDEAIPPARLPTPAAEPAPSSTASDEAAAGRSGLLAAFDRVFGSPAEASQDGAALAQAGQGTAGIRR